MKEHVRTILDYPVKGIQFRDITTLLQDAGHFRQVIDEMTNPWKNLQIDAVLSIESRGFIMAGAIAYHIGAAFIPLRKPDKLPGETFKVSYFHTCFSNFFQVIEKLDIFGIVNSLIFLMLKALPSF